MCAASRPAARSRQTLIPKLEEINDSMAEHIEDGAKFTEIGASFTTRSCAAAATTMIAVVGSLETLWTGHLNIWAKETAARGEYLVDEQAAHRADRAHQADRRIEAGDAERARKLAAAISPTPRHTSARAIPNSGSWLSRRSAGPPPALKGAVCVRH